MRKSISIIVVEDDKYYNELLSGALKRSINYMRKRSVYHLALYSFTDSWKCIRKIKSGELIQHDTIAFVDYYLGDGINGAHIIKLIREQNKNATVVLISQSRMIEEKRNKNQNEYFMIKDSTTPALCRLHLEQFIENKID